MTLVQVSDRISDDISLADARRVPETETIMIDRVDVSDMIVGVAVQRNILEGVRWRQRSLSEEKRKVQYPRIQRSQTGIKQGSRSTFNR